MAAPFQRVITLDFETYYSNKEGYTLSKMTTEEYVRDSRFKAHGASIKTYREDDARWVSADELPLVFDSIDWSTTAVLAHNAIFDCTILGWRYNVYPAFYLDTLSMARAMRGPKGRNSLADLAADFHLPPKGDELSNTDGLTSLTPEQERKLAGYCLHDGWLCEQIFDRFGGLQFPNKELRLIDMVVRMYVQPRLLLDGEMLKNALEEEAQELKDLLAAVGLQTEKELASDEKMAAILTSLGVDVPMKTTPKGNTKPAFAKTDVAFQALLEHPNTLVAGVASARLKVKSTQARTRAQRLLDISKRGPLPVPLHYYGAHTGRIQAARGEALNMQNMKRGSFLRRAIIAPKGYVVGVVDLAQIEPRVLAWYTDNQPILQAFRAAKDVYATFGAGMFGIPGMTKESHPVLRQSAKSALLGCFGADTLVLTKRGWVPIVQVQATDLVWDGEEWVQHAGVVAQGEKDVLTAQGVSATSDHGILTERGWREWHVVLADPSLLRSALSLATLPALDGNAVRGGLNGLASTSTNHACAAHVDGKASSTVQTCEVGAALAATTARKRKPSEHAWPAGGWRLFVPTLRTEIVCWIGSARLSFAALTHVVRRTLITVGEGLRSTLHGFVTGRGFSSTSLAYPAGIGQSFNSTESTTTKATYRETCGSLRAASTWPTSAASLHERLKRSKSVSLPLKQRMQTYDIAHAGPRNRYMVLTDSGPILVHNCGYGLGWQSFAAQLLVGFLGAPPVRYDMSFLRQMKVGSDVVLRFMNDVAFVDKAVAIPHKCSDMEVIVHSIAAAEIINRYRAASPKVVRFWRECGEFLRLMSLPGPQRSTYRNLDISYNKITLPNGMALRYPRLSRDPESGNYEYVLGYARGTEVRTKIYGSKLTENIVQAIARIVITDGMLRIQKRYPVVLTVHDEAVALIPEAEAEEGVRWMIEQVTVEPSYLPGIPLAAEGGAAPRYGDAKH